MPEKRSKTSWAFHLNAILFFRQLRIMLWLDILICVMFAVGLFYYTEISLYALLADYAQIQQPSASRGAGRSSGGAGGADGAGGLGGAADTSGALRDGMVLYRDANRCVYWLANEPGALYPPEDWADNLPPNLLRRLPEPWRSAQYGRRLYYSGQADNALRNNPTGSQADNTLRSKPTGGQAENVPHSSLFAQAEDLVYQLSLAYGGGWLAAEARVGLPVSLFARCLLAILILETLSLLISLRRNSRSIRKTLKPLQELTVSARALTAKGGRLSPEALKRLAGALDSINAGHLDARLPLSGISDELKPLAGAINEMLARIDDAYREQIRFVSDASHELRTPIAVIQGYADILSRWGTEDPETMKESIAAIRQEATAMKEMVEQLLFLARGGNDLIHIDWKAVDLSALGTDVCREVEMIDEKHRFSAAITPMVITEGDDGMLKQLIRILVDNSIKYTPAGGQISLRVEERDGQAVIAVQDEGAGIPEEAMPYIFDRFYRADESRTRETGGAGLGLSIAKSIAQRHNGSIEVTSREGIGTRMTVLLPLINR